MSPSKAQPMNDRQPDYHIRPASRGGSSNVNKASLDGTLSSGYNLPTRSRAGPRSDYGRTAAPLKQPALGASHSKDQLRSALQLKAAQSRPAPVSDNAPAFGVNLRDRKPNNPVRATPAALGTDTGVS